MPSCNGTDTGCNNTRPERELTSYAGTPLRENRENLLQVGKQWTAIARLAGAPSAFGLKTAGQYRKVRMRKQRAGGPIGKAIGTLLAN